MGGFALRARAPRPSGPQRLLPKGEEAPEMGVRPIARPNSSSRSC